MCMSRNRPNLSSKAPNSLNLNFSNSPKLDSIRIIKESLKSPPTHSLPIQHYHRKVQHFLKTPPSHYINFHLFSTTILTIFRKTCIQKNHQISVNHNNKHFFCVKRSELSENGWLFRWKYVDENLLLHIMMLTERKLNTKYAYVYFLMCHPHIIIVYEAHTHGRDCNIIFGKIINFIMVAVTASYSMKKFTITRGSIII